MSQEYFPQTAQQASPAPNPARRGYPDTVDTLTPPADRIFASFLGLAICDALGAPGEFHKRDTYPDITTYQPCAHFNLPPGTPTDDTSMALALGCSILSAQGGIFDIKNQVLNYLSWYCNGLHSATGRCFDIGNATKRSLDLWRAGKESSITVSDPTWANNKGNGSLMRCLPVALACYKNPSVADRWARRQSTVTHPAQMCQTACALYVFLVGSTLRGEFSVPGVGMDKRKFIETMEGWPGWAQDQSEDGKALRAAVTEVWKLKRDQIRSSGYVLHTIQAAVWAFLVTDNFKSGALLCANLGDDADTVAAVYGGIAGAWYGAKDDPEKRFWGDEKVEGWIKGLNMRGSIEKCAEGLAVLEGGCVREIK